MSRVAHPVVPPVDLPALLAQTGVKPAAMAQTEHGVRLTVTRPEAAALLAALPGAYTVLETGRMTRLTLGGATLPAAPGGASQ